MDAGELAILESYLKKLEANLGRIFGRYLIFEHGSAATPIEGASSSCIVHAHIHLIPTAEQAGAELLASLDWVEISGLQELREARANGYALLGLDGCYYLSSAPNLPGQWVRRIVARGIGTPDRWDWSVFPGLEELEVTLDRMNEISDEDLFLV
jgi:hypothetical protein